MSSFQHSAGGVVYREGEILLISPRCGHRWQLPKGHLESGESPQQAALREIQEETGVQGTPVTRLGSLEYDFRGPGGLLIHKRVDYFLFRYLSGSEQDFDVREVAEARWFSWQQGIVRLTFDNEREIVREARRILEEPPP